MKTQNFQTKKIILRQGLNKIILDEWLSTMVKKPAYLLQLIHANLKQKDLPKGIINSLIFCTIIYIIVAALLTGVVPYQELNVSSPVAFALSKIGFPWASALVSTGISHRGCTNLHFGPN